MNHLQASLSSPVWRLALLAALSASCLADPPETPLEPLDEAVVLAAGPASAAAAEEPVVVVERPAGFVGRYSSPTIVRVGTTYHAFFAKQRIGGVTYNVPHATFTADGNWRFVGEALPQLGARAVDSGNYPVWAPAVRQIGGRWVLYYTGHLAGTVGKKCLWRAHAAGPAGPFVDDYAGPIFCAPNTLWAIDPYLVKDGGALYLAARIDQPGGINTIQIRRLSADGAHFAAGSSWSQLTQNSPTSWEQPVLENAGVVKLTPPTKPARWFVFYSAGAWDDNRYGVGYADCGATIAGPCVKKTRRGPWLGTNAAKGVFGPGTPTFYTDPAGRTLMSVQAWEFSGGRDNPRNDGQIMRTYELRIDDNYVPHARLIRVDK
ncbi:MAG: family 43 glycosylhydrolase [Kofleriaceae bacterium]